MTTQWKSGLMSILLLASLSSSFPAQAVIPVSLTRTPAPYTSKEITAIKSYLFANIASEDHVIIKEMDGTTMQALSGAVIASPSHHLQTFSQDYVFHWIRDSALTMREVTALYAAASVSERMRLRPYLINYLQFERKLQKLSSPYSNSVLGEPKFNLDGSLYVGPWGRPQNDGPALRAATILDMAQLFLEEGNESYVRDTLLPMITDDLDFICERWGDANFDIWEEVYDQDHFFNKMVQRKALLQAAVMLRRLGDIQRADNYFSVATQLAASLERHWNPARGYFSETVNQQSYKGGGLNSAIILAVLYGNTGNSADAFAVNNDRVMSSVYFIRNSFAGLYKINLDRPHQPPFLGRYPSDIYDGDQFIYGNPWFLTTNALAEYYYTLAAVYLEQNSINITNNNQLFFRQIDKKLFDRIEVVSLSSNPGLFYTMIAAMVKEGDQLLEAVKAYSACYTPYSCLHLSEQLDRSSGKQTSASDLTWSYATLLSALQAREKITFFNRG